jgi:membrane associated rhomboid family serine protease
LFILPYIKHNPIRRTPWVVFFLILANTLIWISELVKGDTHALFLAHGFVPAQASIATAFTSMFLHAGFWHLAGNMFFFWMFANRVEDLFGSWLFAAGYLLSGFGATAFYFALNRYSSIPLVGASGAISGIAGCFLVLFPSAEFDLIFYVRYIRLGRLETLAWAAVLAWFGEQTLLALITMAFHTAGGVAYWAHFGGFLVGVVIGFLFRTMATEKVLRAEKDLDAEESASRRRLRESSEYMD